MQKTTINGKEIELPGCHPGDRAWLASVLYNIESKHHPADGQVSELQRNAMMLGYEKTYLTELERDQSHVGPSVARRAANVELREKLASYHDMRAGKVLCR
jgi:hypothetical protein